MKEIFVVEFMKANSNETYVDSVWESKEDAQKWVNEMNEWETSERGQGDWWFVVNIDYHAK